MTASADVERARVSVSRRLVGCPSWPPPGYGAFAQPEPRIGDRFVQADSIGPYREPGRRAKSDIGHRPGARSG